MMRDLRIALRTLYSWRFGALGAVLTLAVAIGTTTSLYAFLQATVATTSTQIEDVDRLARIYSGDPGRGSRSPVTVADFDSVLSHTRSFDAIGAWAETEMTVRPGQDDETIPVRSVSAAYFQVVRARPAAGRLFTPSDFSSAVPVALVGERLWRQKFAGRSLSDSPTLTLDGIERRVVGIVPSRFEYSLIGIGGQVWIPLAGSDVQAVSSVFVIARLREAQTWPGAVAELATLAPPAGRSTGTRWHAVPVQDDSRYRTVAGTAATLVPALIILVIGCVNVACMLLARGIERETELSVRAALGASRGAIFGQLVAENLALALAGGTLGTAVAAGLVRLIAASPFAADKPDLAERLSGDLTLLPPALVASAAACLLFGTWPALRLSRRDVSSALKGETSPARVRVAGYGARDLVVFLELGTAAMLVVVSAMWFSFFGALQNVTISFAADALIVLDVAPRDIPAAAERVAAVPGVERISLASVPPGSYRSASASVRSDAGLAGAAGVTYADESFFETTGLEIIRGRGFDRTEGRANTPVAVISESVAGDLWPDEEAIGRELEVAAPRATRVTVIGISRDAIGFARLGLKPGDVYRPLGAAASPRFALLVRAPNARGIVRRVAGAARPSSGVAPPHATVARDGILSGVRQGAALMRLFAGFALIALLLAGTGIFGVISQTVAQRRTEFGVRIALGASRSRVLRMVVYREGKLIAAALGVAVIGTTIATRFLFTELVTVSVLNPAWPASLILLCGFIAAASIALATWRILQLEPADVLRKI